MGEICDCELRSHGPKNLNFFSAKTFTKNDFAKINERNSLDDNIFCFLILEFGEPRDLEVFCNLICFNELLKLLGFLKNSNCINHFSY